MEYSNDQKTLCLYIVIQRQTVSLYQNSSVWLDTVDGRSWDRNWADTYASWKFYCKVCVREKREKEGKSKCVG